LRKANKQPANSTAVVAALLTALLVSVRLCAAQKPSNEEGLTCHGDASLKKDVDGKSVSLQVDPEKFAHSMATLAIIIWHSIQCSPTLMATR
jgi:hypothetical protein